MRTNDNLADRIADLRKLIARLEKAGPVLTPGMVASVLSCSGPRVWQLIHAEKFRTVPLSGARLVALHSVLTALEQRYQRQCKRKRPQPLVSVKRPVGRS